MLDRSWAEIADALKLDPPGEIASALAWHDTWSGIVTAWPVDGPTEPLAVEMSGLPVFDSERHFDGFRGFGICRDVERLALRSRKLAHDPAAPSAPAKVLAFPASPPAADGTGSQPQEHSAFQELARELSERLSKTSGKSGAPVPLEPAEPVAAPRRGAASDAKAMARDTHEGRPILDRLPTGILVYRLNNLIYANRAFLDWTGYPTLEALAEAGGLDSLFIETKNDASGPRTPNGGQDAHHHHASTASRSRSKAACSAWRGTARTRWC